VELYEIIEIPSFLQTIITIIFYSVLTVVITKVGFSLDSLIKQLKQKIEYEHLQKVEWDKQEELERKSTLEDIYDG
jgi:hypothetical protein